MTDILKMIALALGVFLMFFVVLFAKVLGAFFLSFPMFVVVWITNYLGTELNIITTNVTLFNLWLISFLISFIVAIFSNAKVSIKS